MRTEESVDNDKREQEVAELQAVIRRQESALARQERTIARLEREVQAMAGSKVWRLAEFFRRLFRVHLLNWFPSLQLVLFPALRRAWRRFLYLPLERRGLITSEYQRWLAWEKRVAEGDGGALPSGPLLSIVMPVYNVDPQWLDRAIDSVRAQSWQNWQLCIADDASTDPRLAPLLRAAAADDPRIEVHFLPANQGIAGASNAALALAKGEFVGLLDNDDELAVNALLEVARAIEADPEVDCLYSDEDKIDEQGRRYDPFFKPDWSPDTLRSYNYLCHFTVVRRRLLTDLGGFRSGYDGSQDYDLFLRVSERTGKIAHIPQILYHWRAIAGSVGQRGDAKMYAYDSARRALADHLARTGLAGEVADGRFLGSYHIRYALAGSPEVAIIIPGKDQVGVLKRCLDSILSRTSYGNYRLVVVDNGSVEEATEAYYRSLQGEPRLTLLRYPQPFNFSAINNFAARQLESDYLLFLNNDTEVLSPDWLEELLGLGQRPEVGAVGCLLYYPNDTVQHGGVFLGIGGIAGHGHKYAVRGEYGYFGRLQVVQNLSAVTAACLLTRRQVFAEVGGFEERLSHAFNDVDLCLQIRRRGYLVAYTPFAELYHHESLSRGYENTPEKKSRFRQEREFFEERWAALLAAGDPYYSPHLSLTREDFSLRLRPPCR